MSFADLLNKPLPSKTYTESTDDVGTGLGNNEEVDTSIAAGLTPVGPKASSSVLESDESESELDATDLEGLEDDLDDIDLADLSDEELAKLEEDISDSDIDDAVGDEPEVSLSPEEEREADDMMGVAATTELIKSELSAEDQQKFYESVDAKIAVFENLLMESDLYNRSGDVVTEGTRRIFQKTRVQFSKKDRLAELFAVAVNVSAKSHNDPLYTKYQKILRIRRITRAKLRKKYRSEAIRRMKVYYQRLKNSKSPVLNKVAKSVAPSVTGAHNKK
jgi:hypothetical protein